MDSLLKRILQVQSTSFSTKRMNKAIKRIVSEIPNCIVKKEKGNIYITKGVANNYNCIVAHTDTVHEIIPDNHFKVIEFEGRVSGYNMDKGCLSGIGGDDKVGIAIALHALKELPVLKVAFFRDEEVGCHGSQDADMEWFEDCNFVLQCDRKGNSGIVSEIYGEMLFDDEFAEDIKHIISNYGYEEVSGMLTDVYQLVLNGLSVACANIECGYYNPHQSNEYIVLEDYENCKKMAIEMLKNLNKRYEVDRSSEISYYNSQYNKQWVQFNMQDDYIDYCWGCNKLAELDEKQMLCSECLPYAQHPIKSKNNETLELFPDFKLK